MIQKPASPSDSESGDPREYLIRAARVCHPGWQTAGRITFIPEVARNPSWASWRDTLLMPVLWPALEKARAAGACGDMAALLACDEDLDKTLSASAATSSRAKGAALAEGYTVPAGERLLARFGQRISLGETPGHLAILLGLRAAVFHLPVSSMHGAYVLIEACGGLRGGGPAEWLEMTQDCLAQRGDAGTPELRAA